MPVIEKLSEQAFALARTKLFSTAILSLNAPILFGQCFSLVLRLEKRCIFNARHLRTTSLRPHAYGMGTKIAKWYS